MQGEMTRREVNVAGTDWERANCKGINTEIFFADDTDLYNRHLDNRMIRKICFTCTIQKDCLRAGMKEEFGVWGGLTANERKKVRKNQLDHIELNIARRDLKEFGITLENAIEGAI